ncbi:MAG: CRISPR-associated endonuclease Cas2 [Oscillochloris sp.]|nr:CRISPR-associated endonuclease Cas2 [Oscillochloris sp.]
MFIVVSYDIIDDKRRTKVLKHLRGYGTHVQYSVFECDLERAQIERLKLELRDLIDLNADSVRVYMLDVAAVRRIAVLGLGRVTVDPPYYHV